MRKAHLLASAVMFGLLAGSAAVAPASAAAQPWATQVAAVSTTLPYSYQNVQRLLNDLGYNVGTPDGVIGAKSRTAIRAFQADEGLAQSGEPSRTLFDALQTAWAKRFGSQEQPTQAMAPSSEQPTASYGGSNAELVMNIQQELRDRGYNVPLNGQLDTSTSSAIRDYQRGAHVGVTGQASESLLASLQAAPRGGATSRFSQQQIMAAQSALNDLGYNAGPEDGVPGPRLHEAVRLYQTKQGMDATGELSTALLDSLGVTGTQTSAQAEAKLVRKTEKQLQALGYKTGPVDGVLDSQSVAAIKAYQNDNGLAVTGKTSSTLLADLQSGQSAALARATPETTAVSKTAIKEIESRLSDKGYDVGPIDGVMDSQTSAAISAYQRHAGLVQNGLPSQALLESVRTSDVTAKAGTVGDVINSLGNLIQQKQ